jgi:tetratricopeptide (TPR) repeat protein
MRTINALAGAAVIAAAAAHAAPTETQVQSIAAARAEYRAARQALERRDYDEAIEALRRAEQLDSQSADVQNLLGFAHREKGEVKASFAFYERALELNPQHRGAHEYIGRAYLYFGQVAKAREHLAKLGEICGGTCPEHESLDRAIEQWSPWRSGPRMNRTY